MVFSEHILIDVDDILVNEENPRHDPIFGLGQTFIMQQLIRNKKEANAMYKLITDIFREGWFPQSIVTVTYDDEKKKHIAWDGNRRITALKILKEPEITQKFKEFTYSQRVGIYNMSKGIKDKSFFQIPCYVAKSFEECAGYIRSIHTTDTGALRWDSYAIKRFENKLGVKNLFTQLQGYCKTAFDNVKGEFPVSKFERIVSSKVGKKYLDIEVIDGNLTCLSSVEVLDEKVKRIINDIIDGKVTTITIKNNDNISKYLNGESYNESPKTDSSENTSSYNKVDNEKNIQLSLYDSEIGEKNEKNKNIPSTIIGKLKKKFIRKEEYIQFAKIDISKLNRRNERSIGIRDLAYEIQQLSLCNEYKKYPISYCFLIRSLLEQSCIYFLINNEKWNKLKEDNNNRDLRLEKIIEYISRNKVLLLNDDTIFRCWETCFNSEGTKNYLDLVIHHPYRIRANVDAIKTFTDMGLYAIIQYFIQN